jgi:RimJ/RimL family protein N-acetyltransferase
MLEMPILETGRLLIRPFIMDDLEAIHRILDLDLQFGAKNLEERRLWLEWSVRNYAELAKLYQPPLGDRAVSLKTSGEVIGAAGLAPALGPYSRLPSFPAGEASDRPGSRGLTLEIGLYWAIASPHQGRGYATEAGRALIRYAFQDLGLQRIVATTEYTNLASQGVMRKLGMQVERNPYPEPEWFQVVGVLERDEPKVTI